MLTAHTHGRVLRSVFRVAPYFLSRRSCGNGRARAVREFGKPSGEGQALARAPVGNRASLTALEGVWFYPHSHAVGRHGLGRALFWQMREEGL